jgi:iron complex outermembrane recepter protein
MISSHPIKTLTSKGYFYFAILTLLSAPLLHSQDIDATEPEPIIELNPFVVRSQSTLLGDALEEAILNHESIAGGTNLIVQEDLGLRRTLTLKDALELQPGIIIQDFFGSNDQPRIFIRGSGIQSNPQRRGISFLQNGIPLNFSDGSFLVSALDFRAAKFIEVYRGSNALKYGAASLGGAINIESSKGSDINGVQVEAEGGSFGYIGGNIASGVRRGKTDSFASVSYNESDGFRDNNTSSQLNAQANLLWKLKENWENGVYISYTDAEFDVPGPLTWAQLEEDSSQVNPGVNPPYSIGPNVARDLPRRSTQITRIADKSVYHFDKSKQLTGSVYFQQADDEFIYPVATGFQEDDWNDFGLNLEFATLADKNSLIIGTRLQWGTNDRTYSANIAGEKGLTYAANELTASNLLLYM